MELFFKYNPDEPTLDRKYITATIMACIVAIPETLENNGLINLISENQLPKKQISKVSDFKIDFTY